MSGDDSQKEPPAQAARRLDLPSVSLASPASHLPDLAALGLGGVPEFRSSGVQQFRTARSRRGALWNSSPRLRRGEVSPRGARRRRGPTPTGCVLACAPRGEQSVDRTSPPSRWLRQRATSPTSLRSVREEFRNTTPRPRGARSRRSSGVPEFRGSGVPGFSSSGLRDLDVVRFGTPPHGFAVGRCRLAERGDGGDRLRRVARHADFARGSPPRTSGPHPGGSWRTRCGQDARGPPRARTSPPLSRERSDAGESGLSRRDKSGGGRSESRRADRGADSTRDVSIAAPCDARRASCHPHPPRELRSRGDLSRSSRRSSRER